MAQLESDHLPIDSNPNFLATKRDLKDSNIFVFFSTEYDGVEDDHSLADQELLDHSRSYLMNFYPNIDALKKTHECSTDNEFKNSVIEKDIYECKVDTFHQNLVVDGIFSDIISESMDMITRRINLNDSNGVIDCPEFNKSYDSQKIYNENYNNDSLHHTPEVDEIFTSNNDKMPEDDESNKLSSEGKRKSLIHTLYEKQIEIFDNMVEDETTQELPMQIPVQEITHSNSDADHPNEIVMIPLSIYQIEKEDEIGSQETSFGTPMDEKDSYQNINNRYLNTGSSSLKNEEPQLSYTENANDYIQDLSMPKTETPFKLDETNIKQTVKKNPEYNLARTTLVPVWADQIYIYSEDKSISRGYLHFMFFFNAFLCVFLMIQLKSMYI